MTLKRSDVLITRPCSMPDYRRYRATALGWGFLPEPDRRGLPPDEEMMRWVAEAHQCDAKFQGRVELDADWMGMIDFDSNFMQSTVRDLDNKPAVTWWEHTYKGHPSYHFCTNAPGYRRYLMYQLRRIMQAGVDWLMIDSAIPTIGALNARYGGCFCQHCLAGFRRYLKETLEDEERQDLPIKDWSAFDYRAFLLAQGYTDARYRAEILAFPPVVPLAERYFAYQWQEVNALFREFKRYARSFRADVPMSSNSPFYWAEFLYAVDAHDFYTNEMDYRPPEVEALPSEPVYTFKLADALGRLLAITGVPKAFEACRLKDRPGHIRLWIAQAYAQGHVFMVPDKMWTRRNRGEPDRWYYSKPGDYEALYHFVRDYPELFDDYEALATVALVFSNKAVRQYLSDRLSGGHLGGQNRSAPKTALYEALLCLQRENIPAHILIAGDDWVADKLLAADLSAYRAVLRFEPSYLDAEQEAKLRALGERVIPWTGLGELLERAGRDIEVKGAEKLTALPRIKPNRSDSPLVCHLLNSDYDPATDAFRHQRDIELTIKQRLCGRTFSRATLYQPGSSPLPLECRAGSHESAVTIPAVQMWAIVKWE